MHESSKKRNQKDFLKINIIVYWDVIKINIKIKENMTDVLRMKYWGFYSHDVSLNKHRECLVSF